MTTTDIIFTTFALGCLIFVVYCSYMLFRLGHVAAYRRTQIDRAYDIAMADLHSGSLKNIDPAWYYQQIPSFDLMMKKFWVWPLEKFGGWGDGGRRLMCVER